MTLLQYPDDIKEKFGGKFKFIAIAAHRCRQLQKGARQRVQSRSKKFTTVAQEEVLSGNVEFFEGALPERHSGEAGAAVAEE